MSSNIPSFDAEQQKRVLERAFEGRSITQEQSSLFRQRVADEVIVSTWTGEEFCLVAKEVKVFVYRQLPGQQCILSRRNERGANQLYCYTFYPKFAIDEEELAVKIMNSIFQTSTFSVHSSHKTAETVVFDGAEVRMDRITVNVITPDDLRVRKVNQIMEFPVTLLPDYPIEELELLMQIHIQNS